MGHSGTATLAQLLAYENDEVVARFCKTWSTSRPQGRRIFADLMRYLWLTVSSGEELAPVWVVDEMWHAFLMYTRDYGEFSSRYFGRMIHHVPTTLAEHRARQQLLRRSPARARVVATKELTREVALVMEHLGERVMLRWYVAYAKQFGARFRRTFQLRVDCNAAQFSPELRRKARLT